MTTVNVNGLCGYIPLQPSLSTFPLFFPSGVCPQVVFPYVMNVGVEGGVTLDGSTLTPAAKGRVDVTDGNVNLVTTKLTVCVRKVEACWLWAFIAEASRTERYTVDQSTGLLNLLYCNGSVSSFFFWIGSKPPSIWPDLGETRSE